MDITLRWIMGLMASIVFIEYCVVYGTKIWGLNRVGKLGWIGVGGIILSATVGQYKMAKIDAPIDWVTALVFISLVISLIGLTLTIIHTRRAERGLP